jgi:subtilase family serine protease
MLPSTLTAQTLRTLGGNVHPLAKPQYDQGPVELGMKLNYITLMLKRSAAQQAAVDHLLSQQQDTKSPLYHKWLTPEQFADRFGARQEDIDRLTNWLGSSGFSIVQLARGRDFIAFSGTSAQVEAALHTPIHRYKVNGELHFANSAEPAVPVELADLVAGFRGLDNFYPKAPKHALAGVKAPNGPVTPRFSDPKNYPGVNMLAPGDLATIYDINALYGAGIDGAGQTLAIAGGSDINLADIETFREIFKRRSMTRSSCW